MTAGLEWEIEQADQRRIAAAADSHIGSQWTSDCSAVVGSQLDIQLARLAEVGLESGLAPPGIAGRTGALAAVEDIHVEVFARQA